MGPAKKIWKEVPGMINLEASNYGEIREVEIIIKHKYIAEKIDGIYRKKSIALKPIKKYKVITPYVSRKGYLTYKQKFVHRLVAAVFLPNPNNLPQINHIEGNKKDNRIWMLEWCTNQHNIHHAVYVLGFTPRLGKKKVRVIKNGKTISEQPTVTEAAKFVNGTSTHVSKVCKGQRPHYKGYQFEYI